MAFIARVLTLAAVLGVSAIAGAEEKKDIVDTAAGAGSFKTLVAAVNAADLVETLQGKGPFTVFVLPRSHMLVAERLRFFNAAYKVVGVDSGSASCPPRLARNAWFVAV